MRKKDRPEFYMTVAMICLAISSFELAYFKYQSTTFEMNSMKYVQAGVMQYQNPADGKAVYIQLFTRK